MAEPEDVPEINALTARSIRALHAREYGQDVIESAIEHAYGVDWQLIRDRTYFVATTGERVVGAGGWSWRATIAGAHGPDDPPGPALDPERDAARIRALYIDPAFGRRGIGRALMDASEDGARAAKFAAGTLTSTLPAIPFYSVLGYRTIEPFALPLPDGLILDLVRMEKRL